MKTTHSCQRGWEEIGYEACVCGKRRGRKNILNPAVEDLPERISKKVAHLKLLVMGTIAGIGGGCACSPNALVKALLAHLIMENRQWVIVDLEAGVKHLGRGTVQSVDGLVVVSEPSMRSLQTASRISVLARGMGLPCQALIINRPPAISNCRTWKVSLP